MVIKSGTGVGATRELGMRVSIGTLVSVLFENPENGRTTLALERTATLIKNKNRPEVIVKAKPFGGGVRLTHPEKLKDRIGNFHYDSERSLQEGDFRILVNPASWDRVKEIARDHLDEEKDTILDPNPDRELAEEFEDTLKTKIFPYHYMLRAKGLVVEDSPVKTDNLHAQGLPTCRIYYLFEARIKAYGLIQLMLSNSERYSDADLWNMAIEDAKNGGKGRANAILAMDLLDLKSTYQSIPLEKRAGLLNIGGHLLAGNVPAILEGIDRPGYVRQA